VGGESKYINWLFNLENVLNKFNIECSDYDEFHIKEAISETERMISKYNLTDNNSLSESMIDEYVVNSILKEPNKKEYYETISIYVKKRLLRV